MKNTKTKRRFLFLITHYEPVVYGAELFAKRLAEQLVTKGHHVDLVTGKWDQSWSDQEEINGVQVHRVVSPKIRYLQTIAFVWPQIRHAQKLISEKDYDYVHAHIFPSLISGRLLRSQAKKIVTIQGGDLADYPEIYGPLAPVLRPLIGSSLSGYDKIHTVSSDLADQVLTLSGSDSEIIPNGVDRELVTQEEYSLDFDLVKKLPSTKYLVFSSSRLTPKNNLENLVQAIHLVRQEHQIDIGLAIAGSGHLQAKLENLISKLRLKKQVKLLGHLPHKQVLSLTKHANLFARVSLQEGFGISVLEALAIGTPVIASQAGGLKDFVSAETSYIPKTESAEAIAKSIHLALNDSRVMHKTSKAQAQVLKRYTWDKVLVDFENRIYLNDASKTK